MQFRNHVFVQILILLIWSFSAGSQPIQLDKQNPHYLNFKGEPLLLVTSAEPYGAVLNVDFDYELYLKTLHDEGMNYTRIFMGSYVEVPGSFGADQHSLIPAPGSFITPWKRTSEPGLFGGEGKVDLDQWNPKYFDRLRGFVRVANAFNIIVEVTFFSATFEDDMWERNPFNDQNNINGLKPSRRLEFNTLANRKVVDYQKKMVAKVTEELNDFDNIFFEISNEPWSDFQERVTYLHKTLIPEEKYQWVLWARNAPKEVLEWQKELATVFRETEQGLPKKHLLAQNYSDMMESLIEVEDNIDILNFHYAWPEIVTANYAWNRPINFDESGFAGTADSTYLKQAWSFMLNGGGIFNNLDYSFYVGKEDGTGVNKAPGGGSTTLRRQLRFLREFMERFDFVKMRPSSQLIIHAPGMEYYCLAQVGEEYAVYLDGRNQGYFWVDLEKGDYEVQIFHPDSGELLSDYNLDSAGGKTKITMAKSVRVALSIIRN